MVSSASSSLSLPASSYRRSAVLWLFLVPAIGGFLFGYDIGATSFAVVQLASFDNNFNALSLKDAPLKMGWFVSSPSNGALLGTLFLMYIDGGGGGGGNNKSNKNYNKNNNIVSLFTRKLLAPIGRRTELRYAGVLYAIGGMLQFLSAFIGGDGGGGDNDNGTSSSSYSFLSLMLSPFAVLSLGRWIYGAGIGFAMHGGPTYLAETTPPSVRGTVVGGKEIAIVVGILAGYAMGYKLCTSTTTSTTIGTDTNSDDNNGWAYVYAATVFGAVLMIGFSYVIPESARYLVSTSISTNNDDDDKDDETARSLISAEVMESLKFVWNPKQARLEHAKLLEHQQKVSLDNQNNDNDNSGGEGRGFVSILLPLLTDPSVRPALTAGLGLVVLQQVTGQPSVLSYATQILSKVPGLTGSSSVLLAVFKVFATSISVVLVETRGRKTLLMIGCSLMCVSLLILTFAFADDNADADNADTAVADTDTITTEQPQPQALDARSILAVLGMFAYIAGYQIGFGPITWLMISEVFPQHIRGKAVALSVSTNFALNAMVQFLVPLQIAHFGMSKTFLIFGVLSAYSLYFVKHHVPETKGLTLEEIEEQFAALRQATSTTTKEANTTVGLEKMEEEEEERTQLLS